jgi:hypothetical protein
MVSITQDELSVHHDIADSGALHAEDDQWQQ